MGFVSECIHFDTKPSWSTLKHIFHHSVKILLDRMISRTAWFLQFLFLHAGDWHAGPFSPLDDTIFQYHILARMYISWYRYCIAKDHIVWKTWHLKELSIFGIYGNQERHANFDNTLSIFYMCTRTPSDEWNGPSIPVI